MARDWGKITQQISGRSSLRALFRYARKCPPGNSTHFLSIPPLHFWAESRGKYHSFGRQKGSKRYPKDRWTLSWFSKQGSDTGGESECSRARLRWELTANNRPQRKMQMKCSQGREMQKPEAGSTKYVHTHTQPCIPRHSIPLRVLNLDDQIIRGWVVCITSSWLNLFTDNSFRFPWISCNFLAVFQTDLG